MEIDLFYLRAFFNEMLYIKLNFKKLNRLSITLTLHRKVIALNILSINLFYIFSHLALVCAFFTNPYNIVGV